MLTRSHIFIFSILWVLLVCPVRGYAEQITIAATEWAPFTTPTLSRGGFLTDIVTTALRRAGYEPHVKFMPWKRALNAVQFGKMDAILGANKTHKRTAYLAYPKWAWPYKSYFIAQAKHSYEYTTPQGMCPSTIGILRGSSHTAYFKRFACYTIVEVNSPQQGMIMLSRNRIDFYLDSKEVLNHFLDTNLKHLKYSLEPVYPHWREEPVYLAFSLKHPKHAKMAKQFDTAIEEITHDGTFDAILKRHNILQ